MVLPPGAETASQHETAPGHYGRGLFRFVEALLGLISLLTRWDLTHVRDGVLHDELVYGV